MVTNRQIDILTYVAVIAIIAASVGLAAYINEPLGQRPHWVHVTGVQFEEGYLNITITNSDSKDYIINEVIIRQKSQEGTSLVIADELVNKPISEHETISICINLNWTSSVNYVIFLMNDANQYFDFWQARAP